MSSIERRCQLCATMLSSRDMLEKPGTRFFTKIHMTVLALIDSVSVTEFPSSVSRAIRCADYENVHRFLPEGQRFPRNVKIEKLSLDPPGRRWSIFREVRPSENKRYANS